MFASPAFAGSRVFFRDNRLEAGVGREKRFRVAVVGGWGVRCFYSLDSNLVFQQNLKTVNLSFVVLHTVNSRYETLQPLIPNLLKAIKSIEVPGTVLIVD